VQLSKQSIDHAIERQRKYNRDGVNAVWLYNGSPNFYKFVNNVPAISLKKNETDSLYYVFPGEEKKIELSSFIKDMLTGNAKYKMRATLKRKQIAKIYKFEVECWRCHRVTPVVAPYSFYTTRCGTGLFNNMSLMDEDLGRVVSELQRKGVKELSDIGTIKKRFSKTMHESYWSNGCKYCDAIIGEFFLDDDLLDYLNTNQEAKPILNVDFELNNIEIKTVDYPHWCFKSDEEFCDE
jgi:hypothetical protein